MKKEGAITFIKQKGYATVRIYRAGETKVPVTTMEKWEALQKLKGKYRTGRQADKVKREEAEIVASARKKIAIKHYETAKAEKEDFESLTPKTLEGKRRRKIKVREWFARQERAGEARIRAIKDREVLRSSPLRWKEREDREKKKWAEYERKAYKWNHKQLPIGKRYCDFPITILQQKEYKQWQESKAILRAFDKRHAGYELLRAEKIDRKRRSDEVKMMERAVYKYRIKGSCVYRDKPDKEESEENEYLQYHNPYTQ